jgi:arylsulfate sulfotransferase
VRQDPLRRRAQAAYLVSNLLLAAVLVSGCKTTPEEKANPIGTAPFVTDTGTVASTRNPQVARYTIRPQHPADVEVQFGPDTNYALHTWTQFADGNHPVSILVAGMRADSPYHLRAVVHFRGGPTVVDADHIFTTGHLAAKMIPPITVHTTPGLTPQPGVELLNPTIGSTAQLLVTDLQGNVLWGYDYPDRRSSQTVQFLRYVQAVRSVFSNAYHRVASRLGGHAPESAALSNESPWKAAPPDQKSGTLINPAKLLPNGDFLLVIGLTSQSQLLGPPPAGVPTVIREVNLEGDTVRELRVETLNQSLAAAGFHNLHLDVIHHDIAPLPNGHWIVLANTTRAFKDLPGRPGVTDVVGDVLVDVDANSRPVWVWNQFDHLDVNRHPMDFPDWTHSNAVLYTKDDGNLIVSSRTQSWVMKIDYGNGKGSGQILWRMGKDGDLKLLNGTSPVDWTYGQHDPEIVGERSAGVFRLSLMDNGNNRVMANGAICGTKGNPACYTTAPIYEIDEAAKTAKLVFHYVYPPAQYSIWGGSVTPLANGDLDVDLCFQQHASNVDEVTTTDHPQVVWRLHMDGTNLYRTQRLPSLYPGVQW